MKILAILFEGFEEEELVAPVAILRRCGEEVTLASYQSTVYGKHKISLGDLKNLMEINYQDYDALLIPGGPHYQKLYVDTYVHKIVHYFNDNQKLIASICAAPTLLGKLGILNGHRYTCFESMNEDFGGYFTKNGVEVSKHLITAKSVAYSLDFAYAIVEYLRGEEAKQKLFKSIYK